MPEMVFISCYSRSNMFISGATIRVQSLLLVPLTGLVALLCLGICCFVCPDNDASINVLKFISVLAQKLLSSDDSLQLSSRKLIQSSVGALSNAVILDRNSGGALSAISMPSRSVETMITMSKSTTTDFDSSGPPPDTPTLTMASETFGSMTTTTSDTLNTTTSFKTAASNRDKDKSVSVDNESYFSASSSSAVLVNHSPMASSASRPTSINLSPAFKQSVRRAVQRRLRRYARELDPHASREVELSILDAIDLALRILERSHGPQNMAPFVGIIAASHSPVTTSISTHLCPTTLSSLLYNVANHAVQGSLKAICLSGKHLLTALNPVAKSTSVPHTYEMVRLDVPVPQAQSVFIPGEWDRDQDYN
ncbi:hypothetical protein EDD17DRAFT_1516307 [Pisolithus thermaeus]|nr:hypothetical protein EV401DRAFT_1895173 [Pisolithus croceorrhizus]KAI6140710.1 hypothetical protein EDD17DRAFT_1516307 [Pisolithus thermaeus]